MYAALLTDVDGVRLISTGILAAATVPHTDGVDTLIESGTAGPDIRFALGYQLASPSMPGFGPRSSAIPGQAAGWASPIRTITWASVTSAAACATSGLRREIRAGRRSSTQ